MTTPSALTLHTDLDADRTALRRLSHHLGLPDPTILSTPDLDALLQAQRPLVGTERDTDEVSLLRLGLKEALTRVIESNWGCRPAEDGHLLWRRLFGAPWTGADALYYDTLVLLTRVGAPSPMWQAACRDIGMDTPGDLAQEIWAYLRGPDGSWARGRSYEPRCASFGAWLYGLLVHQAPGGQRVVTLPLHKRARRRYRTRRDRPPVPLEHLHTQPLPDPHTPEHDLLLQAERDVLLSAIMRLPSPYRQVALLELDHGDWTSTEKAAHLSAELGRTYTSAYARKLLERARLRLAEILPALGYSGPGR